MFGSNGKLLLSLAFTPDEIGMPGGENHKNLEYWKALSPKFEAVVKASRSGSRSRFLQSNPPAVFPCHHAQSREDARQ